MERILRLGRRLRIELTRFTFDIVYRPGSENIQPDSPTRSFRSATSTDNLTEHHNALCHSDGTRMWHFMRSKNRPFAIEGVRKMSLTCNVCANVKCRFYKPQHSPLIKAAQPLERFNVDFEGSLYSTNKHIYFPTILDDCSRFHFIFPCPYMTSITVIHCLSDVLLIWNPGIHSL